MLARLGILVTFALLCGCKTLAVRAPALVPESAASEATLDLSPLQPSNHRRWKPSLATLSYGSIDAERVTLYNIRNCKYASEEEYVVDHYDAEFDLNELMSVDFIVVPFQEVPELAHTMLSFGFEDGRYVIVSVEARLEQGESYSPLAGALRQYELMYVVGDERDLILLRTEHRQADVYVYRAKSTPVQRKALLTDIVHRMNKLVDSAEFYDSLVNNCTTNLVDHVNHLNPGRIPLDYRVFLPGASDRLAYDLGLLETQLPFEMAKRRAHVNPLAHKYQRHPRFSSKIRRL